ncbi:MAG: ATP-binding protein [Candidatus Zixiibacteriota bacterium]|nr:MAG: ATP-binding protein [candidate division Zixibacteria bacterium]
MVKYTFIYPSKVEVSDRMLDDLDRVIAQQGIEPTIAEHLRLAVSEAFTNAVMHGNNQDPSRLVKVGVQVEETVVTADITDQGSGGLARIRRRKPPEPLAENGRGVDLIEHYADRALFREDDDGALVVSISFERNKEEQGKIT